MATSQNGWLANRVDLTETKTVPGTELDIRLRKGNAGFLLRHLAGWFDNHVEDIEAGQLDDWGYAERLIRGGEELSNHASGTAMDLNSLKHPMGVRGTFTPEQTAKIRRHLRLYRGAIRWGGDYSGRPDEMHFEINADPATVAAVAERVKVRDARLARLRFARKAVAAARDQVALAQAALSAALSKLRKVRGK